MMQHLSDAQWLGYTPAVSNFTVSFINRGILTQPRKIPISLATRRINKPLSYVVCILVEVVKVGESKWVVFFLGAGEGEYVAMYARTEVLPN